jgi:hypothetical protein
MKAIRPYLPLVAIIVSVVSAFGQDTTERDKGIAQFREGKYDEAITTLTRYLETEKKSRLARLYLGGSLLHAGKESEARKQFAKANFITKESGLSLDKQFKVIGRKPFASYTDEARRNNISGTVAVAIEFKADGTIGFVVPMNDLPYGLTENAVNAARQIRFEAAELNGKPVTVITVMTYSFNIY